MKQRYEETTNVKKKDLLKVIKNIEKRKVSKFNLEKLDREVKEIAKDIYSRS